MTNEKLEGTTTLKKVTIYKTSDMKCAAALLAVGHDLVDIENHGIPRGRGRQYPNGRVQRSKIKFVFEYSDALHQDLVAYTSGVLQCPIKAAYSNLDLVKSLIANADFEVVDKINNSVERVS